MVATLTFAVESVLSLRDEMQPLLARHYQELAHYADIKLDIDWSVYFKMHELGLMRAYAARGRADNALLGYAVFFLCTNPHNRGSLQAQQDAIFIDKPHRGFGASFIQWCDEQLKREGVQVVRHQVHAAHNWGKLLERQGYELEDLVYSKRLDR